VVFSSAGLCNNAMKPKRATGMTVVMAVNAAGGFNTPHTCAPYPSNPNADQNDYLSSVCWYADSAHMWMSAAYGQFTSNGYMYFSRTPGVLQTFNMSYEHPGMASGSVNGAVKMQDSIVTPRTDTNAMPWQESLSTERFRMGVRQCCPWNGGAMTYTSAMTVPEYLLFAPSLTYLDRSLVEQYLIAKYGI
jgi:hypothetical protein